MIPTLTTPRLSLRPLRPSDAGLMSLYSSDLRLARMTAAIPHPYPPGAAESYIDAVMTGRNGHNVWAMDATRSGGQELIGVILLHPSKATIGYWVGPPFWNTGFASEAVGGILHHAFDAGGFTELKANVFTDNPASRHVLEKAGFEVLGTRDGFSVARNAIAEEWMLHATRESWQAAHPAVTGHMAG